MYQFPIGVVVESFRKEIHEAIQEASKLGLQGIQMYGTRGDFVPEKFTAERRRELLNFAKASLKTLAFLRKNATKKLFINSSTNKLRRF